MMDWIWIANFVIGCGFAFYILNKTVWHSTRSFATGALVASAMLFLWLPILIVVAIALAISYWSVKQRLLKRTNRFISERHAWLDSVKPPPAN